MKCPLFDQRHRQRPLRAGRMLQGYGITTWPCGDDDVSDDDDDDA